MKKLFVITLSLVMGASILGLLINYVPHAGADKISASGGSSALIQSAQKPGNSGRYLIAFKSKPGKAEEKMIKGHGASILRRYSLAPAFAVKVPNAAAADAIAKNPGVDYVEEDLVYTALGEVVPWGIDAVKAPEVWDDPNLDSVKGAGVKVCVIDSGIDPNHPELRDVYKGGYDFVNNDPDPLDDHGHGTHCAGIIAADRLNGIGVVGVAYNVDIYSCKVLNEEGRGFLSDILAAVEWAVDENNPMDIASLSLGGRSRSGVAGRIFQGAYDNGLLIVCASGNDERRHVIGYPAGYASTIAVGAIDYTLTIAGFSSYGDMQELVAPGVNVKSTVPEGTGFETSVTVGSDEDEYEALAMEYSGTTVEIGITASIIDCGLGLELTDFPPEVDGNIALIERGEIYFAEKATNAMAAGAVAVIIYNNVPGIFTGTLGTELNGDGVPWIPVVSMSQEHGPGLADKEGNLVNIPGDYVNWDGTSMACPHVAGVAALVLSANSGLTNFQVRDILNDTAFDLGDPDDPGWDEIYGNGLVDAEAAVTQALE